MKKISAKNSTTSPTGGKDTHERNLLLAIAQLVVFGKQLVAFADEPDSDSKRANTKLIGTILCDKMVNKLIVPYLEICENKEKAFELFKVILDHEVKEAWGEGAEIGIETVEEKKRPKDPL